MFTIRRAAVAVLFPLILAGCAAPQNRVLTPKLAEAIQPLDVQIGIKQPELYADFERSNIAAGAAACGAIPGLGILLAAACGGALGAMDATVNAERAKTADEMVRPLKDAVLDVKFDQVLANAVTTSLQRVPQMKFGRVGTTRMVDDKAYEDTFRASTSSAVMFINLDYRLSSDFSAVEVSAMGAIFPRSPAARTLVGVSPQLPEQRSPLMLHEASYRVDVIYRGTLASPAQAAPANIAAWKGENGRLLRTALNDGAKQVAQLLAEEMQRAPGSEAPVLGKADAGRGVMGDLVARKEGAELIRVPGGALVYRATISPAPVQTGSAAGAVAR